MSMYEPDVQSIEDSPQFKEAVEKAYRERLNADLERHGVKPQTSEEERVADIAAAQNPEQLTAALAKHGMLHEYD